MVRIAGLEPARVAPLPPQSSVSANSTISATKAKSKRIAQIRLREAMDKLDKTLGVTQVDRAATSGNATFAELVEIFKRDIDLSEREEREHSTKTKIIYQLNGFIKHWTKVPESERSPPDDRSTRPVRSRTYLPKCRDHQRTQGCTQGSDHSDHSRNREVLAATRIQCAQRTSIWISLQSERSD